MLSALESLGLAPPDAVVLFAVWQEQVFPPPTPPKKKPFFNISLLTPHIPALFQEPAAPAAPSHSAAQE